MAFTSSAFSPAWVKVVPGLRAKRQSGGIIIDNVSSSIQLSDISAKYGPRSVSSALVEQVQGVEGPREQHGICWYDFHVMLRTIDGFRNEHRFVTRPRYRTHSTSPSRSSSGALPSCQDDDVVRPTDKYLPTLNKRLYYTSSYE